MDYRPQRSWIGNARGWLSKAGYGGSDVTFNNFIWGQRLSISSTSVGDLHFIICEACEFLPLLNLIQFCLHLICWQLDWVAACFCWSQKRRWKDSFMLLMYDFCMVIHHWYNISMQGIFNGDTILLANLSYSLPQSYIGSFQSLNLQWIEK